MPFKIKIMENGGIIPSFWADYEDGARVKIRIASRSKIRELTAEATSSVSRWQNGQLITEEKYDQEKYERLLTNYMVEDWEQFVDAEGTPIPCTDDLKFLLLDTIPGLAIFVLNRSQNAQAHMAQQEAELTENLSDSSNGNGESPSIVRPAPSDVN